MSVEKENEGPGPEAPQAAAPRSADFLIELPHGDQVRRIVASSGNRPGDPDA